MVQSIDSGNQGCWVSFPHWSTSRWNPVRALFNPPHHISSCVC